MNEAPLNDTEDLQRLIPKAKSWGQLYAIVLAELGITIGLLYLFSRVFA
jgi:hypothetical protein